MNEKEIAELRRRFRPEKSNIGRVRGCYVNEKGEILSRFDQSLALTSEEEAGEILSILKKTLSGSLGKNLLDLPFRNNQVVDSDEHRLLMKLKNSALSDDAALEELYGKITSAVQTEGNYMILLAAETYDVPAYSSDGVKKEETSQYAYLLCSLCPVKMTRPALGYFLTENRFKNVTPDWVIGPPEVGFLFPAFDGRVANIYSVLFYTKNTADSHGELIDSLFKTEVPMPAAEQKQSFQALLRDAVADECSYDVVMTVHDKIGELIEEHKASRDPEPPTITGGTVCSLLSDCGVKEEKVAAFGEKFDEAFGKHAALAPGNLISGKQVEVSAPEISIRMSREGAEYLETRVIDGKKYLMILAEGPVEVNGVEIEIS